MNTDVMERDDATMWLVDGDFRFTCNKCDYSMKITILDKDGHMRAQCPACKRTYELIMEFARINYVRVNV